MTETHWAVTLTEPQALMLKALAEACEEDGDPFARKAAPRQLAEMRWPDSRGWSQRSNRGSTAAGGALGATMPMKAATVLWRLKEKGLAEKVGALYDEWANLWQPTHRGLAWLKEHADG
jgi:hypothetical protein